MTGKRWKIFSIVIAGVLLLTVGVWIGWMVFADRVFSNIRTAIDSYVRSRVSTEVALATDKKMKVSAGAIDYGYFIGSLTVHDINIQYMDTTGSLVMVVDIELPSVSISSISPWEILFGSGLSLGTLQIDEPTIRIKSSGSFVADTAPSVDTAHVKLPHIPDVDSLLHTLLVRVLPTYVQPLHIDGIKIQNLSLTNTMVGSESHLPTVLNGLHIVMLDIQVDSTNTTTRPIGSFEVMLDEWKRDYPDKRSVNVRGFHIKVNPVDSLLSIDSVTYFTPKGYTYKASHLLFSYNSRKLLLGSFALGPTLSDADYFATQQYSTDRFRLSGKNIRFENIDFAALEAREALSVQTVIAASIDVDIITNKRLRNNPHAASPQMPSSLIARLPFVLSIDTVRVDSAAVLFVERWPHTAKPAELSWSGVKLLALNLRNSDVHMHNPFTIWARGTFMGQCTMEATLTMPIVEGSYSIDAVGSVGAFHAPVLNRFLPTAENVRISSGNVRSSTFSIRVRNRKCTGTVSARYTDLRLALVDKRTKQTGFFDGLISFFANWIVFKNDNDGEDFESGPVNYTLPHNAAFMQTIWFPVRSGLLNTIKN